MKLETVQGRAVCCVLNNYGRFSSVTSMLDQLSWPTLHTHRKVSRLHTLHKVFLSSVITYNSSVLLTSIVVLVWVFHFSFSLDIV